MLLTGRRLHSFLNSPWHAVHSPKAKLCLRFSSQTAKRVQCCKLLYYYIRVNVTMVLVNVGLSYFMVTCFVLIRKNEIEEKVICL